ncbi:alpha/beta hydrolase family protein [Nonlabens ponticola]|uniref:Alpha/beta fold hydrolase n=1 Tax=Nonlabens ponticola TaxID=2496866 RepID=A0A3S9MVX3_9FLAO|nr:alpha/beta fold hydrolase [Nonlabens ponticola]AZQ43361.1 alpha/beta fold hydrolase [Nonlabens ponticola]
MNTRSNVEIAGSDGKTILLDYKFHESTSQLPVVIFCHGLKGFKDWGAWDLMGSAFAKAGFLFIKFNFSHNGGTPQQPIDFPDLEAFAENNYSKELEDLQHVLNWLELSDLPYDPGEISLLGHSRAGGITTITAANDSRIQKLITLAGVADYQERFPKGTELKQWKKNGVYYVKNGRTKQEMPFNYQMYEDFVENEQNLNIRDATSKLNVPHLIIHGTADPTVDVKDAHRLHQAGNQTELSLIMNANHVFGASHPWQSELLPADLRLAVQCSINFLKEN